MTLNCVKAVTLRYFTATTIDKIDPDTFMVLGGTVPTPHISGPALYCIFFCCILSAEFCLATKSVYM